jgi:hypothetical protein
MYSALRAFGHDICLLRSTTMSKRAKTTDKRTATSTPTTKSAPTGTYPTLTCKAAASQLPSACGTYNNVLYTDGSGNEYQVECYTDRSSTKSSTPVHVDNFEQCIAGCISVSSCVDVSFNPDPNATYNCYLNSDASMSKSNSNILGARYSGSKGTSTGGKSLPARPMSASGTSSASARASSAPLATVSTSTTVLTSETTVHVTNPAPTGTTASADPSNGSTSVITQTRGITTLTFTMPSTSSSLVSINSPSSQSSGPASSLSASSASGQSSALDG